MQLKLPMQNLWISKMSHVNCLGSLTDPIEVDAYNLQCDKHQNLVLGEERDCTNDD